MYVLIFKIAAMTVNGTGPATSWMEQATFVTDLDETVVPDPPSSLRARASDDQIQIKWTPPRDNQILVRGYTIGWGVGIADEYTELVDDKERYFVLAGLSKWSIAFPLTTRAGSFSRHPAGSLGRIKARKA